MLTDHQIKAAYRGDAIPASLTGLDRVQFICLRRVYAGYKTGEIGREEAEKMKGYIMRYEALPHKEKESVLNYCFALLCADAEAIGGGTP